VGGHWANGSVSIQLNRMFQIPEEGETDSPLSARRTAEGENSLKTDGRFKIGDADGL
jgi:hypothetical protein